MHDNQTVLVTGGAGFIGSHTCEALLKSGYNVISIDNFSDYYSPEYKRENIKDIMNSAGNSCFISYEGDIRDMNFLDDVFNKSQPDIIIHLAACAGVRSSILNPVLFTEVNINGTVNILECIRKYNINKLLFASSSSVYGNNVKLPLSDFVDRPISPYAATKKAGELLCHTYHHLYDINAACLRFFTVYGPRQRPDLAVYKFTKLILEGKPIPFYGDGTTQRDYTFINDITEGILKAVEWVDGSGKRFDIFNLGEASTVTLSQMLQTLENELGLKAKLDIMPRQPGDVNKTYADISHSREVLGYNPATSFEQGIKSFVRWYKQNRLISSEINNCHMS
jgi:UDP-glucuronate 4-epimerase